MPSTVCAQCQALINVGGSTIPALEDTPPVCHLSMSLGWEDLPSLRKKALKLRPDE